MLYKKMKNKKGLIKKETLKLILAVIVIGFLFILAFKLYGIFVMKSELEQARETLKQIVGKIESLEENQEISYLVTAPKGWCIVAYNEGREMPESCKGKTCLCICSGSIIEDCEKTGVCENINNALEFKHQISQVRCLIEVPEAVFIKKEPDKISLSVTTFETEIIDNLLNKKVIFNNAEKTILNYLKEIVSHCQRETAEEIIDKAGKEENKDLQKILKREFEQYQKEKSEEKGYGVGIGVYVQIYFEGKPQLPYALKYVNEPGATVDLRRIEIKEVELCNNEGQKIMATVYLYINEPKEK